MYSSHIQPFHISDPSGSKELHLSPIPFPPHNIYISKCVSQLKPFLYQLHPGHEMYISHPSMSTLTSIKVPILVSHLHSSNISLAFRSHLNLIQVTIISSQLHLGANIPPFRFWGKLITSTHTASQLHEAPYIYISPPSKSSIIPDQILISVYHPEPGPHYCILE